MRMSDCSSDVCSSDLPDTEPQLPRPLAGKRVVELSQFIAGPTAAQYLADFGDDVTKIESPQGDGVRTLPGNTYGSYSDRKIVVYGRSVSVRVDPGGRRIFTIT